MKKTLALVGLLAIAGLGVGVLTGCHKDEPVDPDPGTVDNDGPEELEHDWVETSHVDATCTAEGSVTYTCAVCRETETLTVPALGHEWGNAYYVTDEGEHNGDWAHTCVRVNNGVVCGAIEYISTEEGSVPEGTTLEPTDATELKAALVNGATVVIPTVEEDGEEVPFAVNEEITIKEGVSVTIDLGEVGISGAAYEGTGGNTVVYSGLIVVQEGGTLTLEGEGGLIQTHKQSAVLVVDHGGTCIVNGGSYMVQADTASSSGNANYTVVNDGTLIINDGFFGTVNSGSSLIINGPDTWSSSAGDKDQETALQHTGATLEINGGTFLGGKHVVKSSDHGELTITGGYFDGFITGTEEFGEVGASDDLIYDASGSATISGGVFGATNEEGESEGNYEYAVRVGTGTKGESEEAVALTITGGTFYSGTKGLFNIDAHTGDGEGSIILSASVYVSLSTLLSAEGSGVTVTGPEADGSYVVTRAESEE